MCILVFDWQPGTEQPLLMLSNRDEFHARPTAPLAQWADQPLVHAGRDLEAGGSWLGIAPGRRLAALTNIRAPQEQQLQSRGELVSQYLASGQQPGDYLQELSARVHHYNGFNLLVGTADELWFLHSAAPTPVKLAAGIYALCNASLDTPWPKLVRLRTAFAYADMDDDEALLALMQDDWQPDDSLLPDTGVGMEFERQLSSIFIRGEDYGTRAISLLRMTERGIDMVELSFAAGGLRTGEQRMHVA